MIARAGCHFVDQLTPYFSVKSTHGLSISYIIRSPYSYLQLYLIGIDARRSLYDANKCLVSFCRHLFCVRRPKRPPAWRRQLGSNGCKANCRCSAVTDRYTGAILPFGTGLLTVFLNREVTVLPGLFLTMGNHLGLTRVTTMEG